MANKVAKDKEKKYSFNLKSNDNPNSAIGHFMSIYESGLFSKQILLRELVTSGSLLHQLNITRDVVTMEASGQFSAMSPQDKARWVISQCQSFINQTEGQMVASSDNTYKAHSTSNGVATAPSEPVVSSPDMPSEKEVEFITETQESVSPRNSASKLGNWGGMKK